MSTKEKVDLRLLTRGEVLGKTGMSYTTIWDLMQKGQFPRARDAAGAKWFAHEIDAWLLSRPFRRLKGDAA